MDQCILLEPRILVPTNKNTYFRVFFILFKGKRAYMFYWYGCDVAIRGTSPTFCEPYFYGNGKYPGIPEMADSIYKGIQLFKNDSADLVGKYLQEMFVDTEGVHLRIYYI